MAKLVNRIVVAPLGAAIPPGYRIGLTPEQAASREHAITPVKGEKGLFDVHTQTMFKLGEVVKFPEDRVPKSSANGFDIPEGGDKPAKGKGKTKAAEPDETDPPEDEEDPPAE
jgi:hypothetical protein